MPGAFYLHEDDWGMISLEPRENHADRLRVVADATAHADAHRSPDGLSYTAIYVAPAPAVSLSVRKLTLEALATELGPTWARYDRVISGYSSYREDCPESYAFHLASATPGAPGDDLDAPVFYGSVTGGVIDTLNLAHRDKAVASELLHLGTAHQLILVDLWWDTVVDLADQLALMRYLSTGEAATGRS